MNLSLDAVIQGFGPVRYAIPRLGDHGLLSCLFGNHWWTFVRQEPGGRIVAIACGACRKLLAPIHDVEQGLYP